MSRLSGKVAVITGGNSGIGFATASLMASEGAQVVVTGRNQRAVEDAVRKIGAAATGMVGDVADIEHHASLANEIQSKFGKLDIYVANAGINTIIHSAEVTPEQYDAQFSTNTRGVFFGVQKMLPHMRDGGSIILTGSIAAEKVLEGHAVYAASKAAIAAFARSWALELKERKIRVNVISPGPVDTAILGKMGVPPEHRQTFEKAAADAVAFGRLGRPEEIAQAVLFLASDASSFITGVNLRVDGGTTLL